MSGEQQQKNWFKFWIDIERSLGSLFESIGVARDADATIGSMPCF